MTSPHAIRAAAGLLPPAVVDFVLKKGGVRLVPAPTTAPGACDWAVALPGGRARHGLIGIIAEDPAWCAWSGQHLAEAVNHAQAVIGPIIFAEVSTGWARIEGRDAAFPAGKAFATRTRRAARSSQATHQGKRPMFRPVP